LTGAKNPVFSTNHLADIDKTNDKYYKHIMLL